MLSLLYLTLIAALAIDALRVNRDLSCNAHHQSPEGHSRDTTNNQGRADGWSLVVRALVHAVDPLTASPVLAIPSRLNTKSSLVQLVQKRDVLTSPELRLVGRRASRARYCEIKAEAGSLLSKNGHTE